MPPISAFADAIYGVTAAVVGIALGHPAMGALAIPLGLASLAAADAGAALGEKRLRGATATSVAVGLSAFALSTFATLLAKNTHHHGLAGTTFALAGIGIVAASIVVGVRVAAVTKAALSWVVIAIGLALVGFSLFRGAPTWFAVTLGIALPAFFPVRGRGRRIAAGLAIVLAASATAFTAVSAGDGEAPHDRTSR